MGKIENLVTKGTSFGTFESKASLGSFILKVLLFLTPAVLISHILDEYMNAMYMRGETDSMRITSLSLQTILMIVILYLFVIGFESYSKEFQTTVAGGFFIAMFFGFQPHYLQHLKEYMRRIC